VVQPSASDDIGMDYSARRSTTLALRIHFNGRDGLEVSATTQDNIESLIPWLRKTLTRLRLPHPKSQNIIKPHEATSIIDMYWDVDLARVRSRVLLCPPFSTDLE